MVLTIVNDRHDIGSNDADMVMPQWRKLGDDAQFLLTLLLRHVIQLMADSCTAAKSQQWCCGNRNRPRMALLELEWEWCQWEWVIQQWWEQEQCCQKLEWH